MKYEVTLTSPNHPNGGWKQHTDAANPDAAESKLLAYHPGATVVSVVPIIKKAVDDA